ncbi:helix-turn-helix transcriptional regulator [Clostridium sp. D33t1_170424_F3]|uniref:helix-turn-helix domain-containing protein n=1 Tax=Clostridium sp. D33t1_170424_F3 TaxID=2787099 RepID=UPI0018AB004D|nr:helix-turn-helix transcriptional regulator [Clostridium sp. D33t1_170424_F3]
MTQTKQAVANRIKELCAERNISVNAIANISGIPPMSVYSMLNTKSKNPGIVNIKKLCDGFEITLGEFFSTPEFDALEQEIK